MHQRYIWQFFFSDQDKYIDGDSGSLSWKVDRVFDYRVLGARIRDQERKMITMGSEPGHVSHDITPIHKVLDQIRMRTHVQIQIQIQTQLITID